MNSFRPALLPLPVLVSTLLLGCIDDPEGSDASTGDLDPNSGGMDPVGVAVDDPFIGRLDHVRGEPSPIGFEIVGFDKHDIEVGRVAVFTLGPEWLRVTHEYPRRCDDDPERRCVDVLEISVGLLGAPAEWWAYVEQTLPSEVLLRRTEAIARLANAQPDPIDPGLGCALGIATAAAWCMDGDHWELVGTARCSPKVRYAVCVCPSDAFRTLDYWKICNP